MDVNIKKIVKLMKKDKLKKKILKQKQKKDKVKQTQNIIINLADKKRSEKKNKQIIQKPSTELFKQIPQTQIQIQPQLQLQPQLQSQLQPQLQSQLQLQPRIQPLFNPFIRNIVEPIQSPILSEKPIKSIISKLEEFKPIPKLKEFQPINNFSSNTLSQQLPPPIFKPNETNDFMDISDIEQNIFSDQAGNISANNFEVNFLASEQIEPKRSDIPEIDKTELSIQTPQTQSEFLPIEEEYILEKQPKIKNIDSIKKQIKRLNNNINRDNIKYNTLLKTYEENPNEIIFKDMVNLEKKINQNENKLQEEKQKLKNF